MGAEATAAVEARPAPAPQCAARAAAPRGLAGDVLTLQRQAGNRGTRAALARQACAAPGPPSSPARDGAAERDGAALLRSAVARRRLARQTTPKVCGPDVTARVRDTLSQVQRDFGGWTPDQKIEACDRILIPLRAAPEPGEKPPQDLGGLARSFADINGWDIHALFQGESAWLRAPPVCGPCARPTSSVPPATGNEFDDAHEDPRTCSNTVTVDGQCWLNGTVNYGLFGIMLRLCADNGTWAALWRGEKLIELYKSMGAHPENPMHPLNWVRATYHGGPGGTPVGAGNRPSCAATCSVPAPGAPAVNWDYVWEPVHPRSLTPPAERPPETRDPAATV